MIFGINRIVIVGCVLGWQFALGEVNKIKYNKPKSELNNLEIGIAVLQMLLIIMAMVKG